MFKLFLAAFGLSGFLLIINFPAADNDLSEKEWLSEGEPSDDRFIRGVYGNPTSLLEAGHTFRDLGLNAIFIRRVSLNRDVYEQAKKEQVNFYVEFPTLEGRSYLEDHPEAWPITAEGERAARADWFMGICPTDPDFQEFRREQLKEVLETYQADGIWLDYLHWHAQFESSDPILPETCFCERCIEHFQDYSRAEVPAGDTARRASWILQNADPEWREWRQSVIIEWVGMLREVMDRKDPDLLLGIFYASWYPEDHEGALGRILGLDIDRLAESADVLSPMLYHSLKELPPDWVGEYTSWLGEKIGSGGNDSTRIWPILQAHNRPGVISADEFQSVLEHGAQPPSTGVMMFSEASLLDDPEKLEVMKQFYLKKEDAR